MVDDATLIVSALSASPGLLVIASKVFERFAKKADTVEATLEATKTAEGHSIAAEVKQISAAVSEMRADMRVLLEKLSTYKSQADAYKERLEGVATDHGRRLKDLEATTIRLEENSKRGRR